MTPENRTYLMRQLRACGESLLAVGATYDDAELLFKEALCEAAVRRFGNNQNKAAAALKVHRNTISRQPFFRKRSTRRRN